MKKIKKNAGRDDGESKKAVKCVNAAKKQKDVNRFVLKWILERRLH
ncbi:MAG: hypothetical protein U0X76_10605 [Bacteroidia bacterium]